MFDNAWTFIAGGTVLGVIASLWGKLKAVVWRVTGMLIQRVELSDSDLQHAVVAYLVTNYQRSRNYDRTYGGTWENRKDGKFGFIPFERFGDRTLILWNGWFPFLFVSEQTKAGNDGSPQVSNSDVFSNASRSSSGSKQTLIFVRGTLDVDAIAKAASEDLEQIHWATVENDSKRWARFAVYHVPARESGGKPMAERGRGQMWYARKEYRLIAHEVDQLGLPPTTGKALDNLVFPQPVKDLIHEIELWHKSKDWYREKAIPWKRGWLLFGQPGTGKCLAKGTPVLMFDGTIKPVQDVAVGDRLMGPDSKPRTVLSLARGVEAMYDVVPNKGDPYTVNESHMLSLKMSCSYGGYEKGEIVNLAVRDYLRKPASFKHYAKGWRTGVRFAAKTVSLDPYLLGVWLGNGHLHKCNLTILQPEVVAAVAAIAQGMGISLNWLEDAGLADTYSVGIPGTGQTDKGENPFRNALKELGLFRNEKFVPHAYLANSREVRLELLAGLIDTDGSLDRSGAGYDVTFKSKQLADGTAFVARSLGFAAYVRSCVKVCTNNGVIGTYYRFHISGDVSEIPVRVRSKVAHRRKQKKNVLVTGIDVVAAGVGDYYGFEIDGDRLFLLGDFTVTHNTALARAFAEDMNMPIYAYSLAELSNPEMQRAWRDMQMNVPCVALIEDIDNVFHGRENITRKNGGMPMFVPMTRNGGGPDDDSPRRQPGEDRPLTFDCLLNCLDGVEKSDGVFTIVTTNDISKIDPALGSPQRRADGSVEFISTRPGRLDKAIELGHMTADDKKLLAKRILGDSETAYDEMVADIDHHQDRLETPAQFQERCAQIALRWLWGEQQPKPAFVPACQR